MLGLKSGDGGWTIHFKNLERDSTWNVPTCVHGSKYGNNDRGGLERFWDYKIVCSKKILKNLQKIRVLIAEFLNGW